MGVKLRKFYVGLISLEVVLVIYLVYNRVSETPQIDFDTVTELPGAVADSNGKIGTIGNVGIGKLDVAEFITRNKKTKEIERRFGFEKVLREEMGEWDVEKPYMDLFRTSFKCSITADRGKVQIESVGDRHSPKDATFTGNVTIRVLPEKSTKLKKSSIYVDDVIFVSEKSQFLTAGPVRFVSEDAQMLGRGLEFVYNSQEDRLEFLRVIHLESLRLKAPKEGLFGASKRRADRPADAGSPTQTEGTDTPVAADHSQQAQVPAIATAQPAAQREGEYFKCVFSKNVVIETPERLVFADDQFSINNILWAKSSSEKSEKSEKSAKADTSAADKGKIHVAVAARPDEPTELPEQLIDIVVTCDDGILVMPMNSSRSIKDFAELKRPVASTNNSVSRDFEDTAGRTTLVAKKIDYCASTENTVVGGPLELTFDVNDPMRAEANAADVPVKVTARKEARFFPASNQAIFEGDCVCTMVREDPNSRQEYTLSAPKLTVDLSKDKASRNDIEHLAASGGVVRLAIVKTAEGESLGGTELKCLQVDYDTGQQYFLATGPGVMKVDNSYIANPNISGPNSRADRFSLKKPCWAIVRDFDSLQYFFDANQVVANARPGETLVVDYFPVVQGQVQDDRQATATAGHVEALLYETVEAQLELSTLTATGAITYEDGDKEFAGSQLFYDSKKAIIEVRGEQLKACRFNGVPVDKIEWDLKTDKFEFEIAGPGAFETRE